METLRLYAGWLFTWYVLIFTLGSYQTLRKLPFHIPYVDELFASPLLYTFSCGTFLFLLGTSVFKISGKGALKGLAIFLLCLTAFLIFEQNT